MNVPLPQTKLAESIGAEVRVQPARLDVSTPWELPESAKGIIGESIAGDAWLQRLGLEGLLTGIANADMRVYKSSVERLAGMLRYAREEGQRVGAADQAMAARVRVCFAGVVGFVAGAGIAALIYAL